MTNTSEGRQRPGIDSTVPHSARVWNYFLGGKDFYPVDRAVGEEYTRIFPDIMDIARADRAFLGRAVRYMAGEAGIRQFLDIGTGLPTLDNTHEVAQQVAPESRIVYVDNDPLVLVHAEALLVSTPEGACDYIEADFENPDLILEKAARTLDFGKPVGITLLGLLHFNPDLEHTLKIVKQLLDAVPSGSFLALTHSTMDMVTEEQKAQNVEAQEMWNENATASLTPRGYDEVMRYFEGLELLEPGLVSMSHWRVEDNPWGVPAAVAGYAGVGRKP